MHKIKNYCLVDSLDQAYELKKKGRNHVIVGGNLWLKMGNRPIQTAIDLSALGLNQIEETEEEYRIGCMVTLRDLEVHESLNNSFHDLFREAVRHIVGVQFRNCATVGGSIYPRFGFSDVLTAFLACESRVCLYQAGEVPLDQFLDMPYDNDILTHMIVKKEEMEAVYDSFRMTETDFPVLTCAVSRRRGRYRTVIGARPKAARAIDGLVLNDPRDETDIGRFASEAADQFDYGSNMRGSAGYRRDLAEILIRRCLHTLGGRKD
ncbi:MAG: FAD binding domain-containing protein [Eubacterium sp.]|nr:FAD binding domain-containing protein [Eubacterium sp.]